MVVSQERVQLNDQQLEAVDYILNSFKTGTRVVGLYGTGGTGKTESAREIANHLQRTGQIIYLAPTNMAAKQLSRSLSKDGIQRRAKTIASALGLVPTISEDGSMAFESAVSDEDNESSLSSASYIFIDEGSMVSAKNAQAILANAKPHAKILILMDRYQLPPVNERDIYFETQVSSNNYELTKTMRYSDTSYIYKVITDARNAVISKNRNFNLLTNFPQTIVDDADTNAGYHVKSESEGLWSLVRACRRMRELQKYDFVRCICWRNKEVNRINDFVRWGMFPGLGENMSYLTGELLVTTGAVQRTVMGRDMILYPTATQLVVDRSFKIQVRDDDGTEWDAWETIVYDPDEDFNGNSRPLRHKVILIDQYARTAYYDKADKLQKGLKVAADEYGYKSREWFKVLTKLKSFQSLVDSIRPSYAITAHGSQGMSIDVSYLNLTDTMQNKRDYDVKNRCNFVGASRARNSLVVF